MLKEYPTVSIIIPVYNAETTLPVCLQSLQALDYPSLEIIFINDCSGDGSVALLQQFSLDFSEKGKTVKRIDHTINKGVAAARNTGLDQASGTYVYYVDADDRVDPETIRLTVACAEDAYADIVGFNWFLSFASNERTMNQPSFADSEEAVQLMLCGTMRWNLWLFLVKRSLYEDHGIRFLPGMNMGEDMMVMIKLFVLAKRAVYLDRALYHYRQSNEASLTKTYSQQHIDQVTANLHELETFLKQGRFANQLDDQLGFLKLNIKLPFLISSKTSQYRRWLDWFPEANGLVLKNKSLPWRTRMIQFFAVKKQFWLLKIYYYFVIRLVYGLIYR